MIQAPVSPEVYPGAVWYPIEPYPPPYHQGDISDKNQITDHISESGPDSRGSLAWYANLKDKSQRLGTQFYISQDGTVYQTCLAGRTTWHASQVNAHSIGIEHAASSGTDPKVPALPVSDAQYAASAKLHAWISKLAKIPLDRMHVRSHWEASPADGHRLCCIPTLDLDKLVAMAKVELARLT